MNHFKVDLYIYSRQLLIIVVCACVLLFTGCDEDTEPPDPPVDPPVSEKVRLPHVFVNTGGHPIEDEPKIDAVMIIRIDDSVVFNGYIAIETRGSSSQTFPKKSYAFETRDEQNEDLDVSLLGLPEEEDWVLYAPYSDKSLLRNRLIYDLSNDIGRYASRCVFVELSLNNVYKGVYVLMEKLKRDKNRIDINKLRDDEITGEDLTGGYIIKIDKTEGDHLGEGYSDENSFTSSYTPLHSTSGQQIHFLYDYPDARDITIEQKNYISTYVSDFEDVLASADFQDEQNGYPAYIDVSSFVDFFLLNELSNNVDGYRLSTFMYKDKNDKLTLGPIWDFNLAFGNANYCGGGLPDVWAYRFNQRCPGDFWQVPFWWERLLQDPAFVSAIKDRWNTLRLSSFSENAIIGYIDAYTLSLHEAEAIHANFNAWNILGTWVWPNKFVGNTHHEEINYLKDWIRNRMSWMDNAINAL